MEQDNNFIKKISYSPFFVKMAQILHARFILRKTYYFLFRPKNNILSVTLAGINANFYVKTPDELRLVESVTGDNGERRVLESFIKLLKKSDVVYDVGANMGVYAILLSKAVGREGEIIAFEPEKESLVRFKENIEINKLENIILEKKALGEKAQVAKLYISGTTGNFSLVNIYDKESKSEMVEIVNGDEFVFNQNLPIPNAIKIDVEGYEYSVIKGLEKTLTNKNCRIICCEVHVGLFPEGVTEESILKLIKGYGFAEINIFKRGFSAYHIIAIKK